MKRWVCNVLTVVAVCIAIIGCIGLFWLGLDLLKIDGWCLIGGLFMILGAGAMASVPAALLTKKKGI